MILFEIDASDIDRMRGRVTGLGFQLRRPAGLMRTVAEGIEYQTRRRVVFEKRGPDDGKPWAAWSTSYAKTRKPHHSLLRDTDAFLDDIDHRSTATTATTFTTIDYMKYHQSTRARTKIPARRPFGLSKENARDLENWLAPALLALAGEALRGDRVRT